MEFLFDGQDHLMTIGRPAAQDGQDEPVEERPDEPLAISSVTVLHTHGGRSAMSCGDKRLSWDCRVLKEPLSTPPRISRRGIEGRRRSHRRGTGVVLRGARYPALESLWTERRTESSVRNRTGGGESL